MNQLICFLCFVMIFGFAIENHAKTGNVFLLYLGLTPEAINIPFLTELFNHDAVCRIFDMDVSSVYYFVYPVKFEIIPQNEFDNLIFILSLNTFTKNLRVFQSL